MSASRVLEGILDVALDGCSIAVCLASQSVTDEPPRLEALQITRRLEDSFRGIVSDYLSGISASVANGDMTLRRYAAGYRPDGPELEWLQSAGVENVTNSLQCVPDPAANAALFGAEDDFIAGLHFYVIAVEVPRHERVLFFRKYTASKELSRSKWLAAVLAQGSYDTIRQPAFLFDGTIDCFARDGYMFISRKHDFQTIFRFFEKVREKAHECLGVIEERVPIANFPLFAESCESHLHKLTKLLNIAAKPYLATVTMTDLKRTIRKFNLKVETVRRNGREMLVFDPAHRWEILKLLDDDYLGSVMTKLQYEVNSKRMIEA